MQQSSFVFPENSQCVIISNDNDFIEKIKTMVKIHYSDSCEPSIFVFNSLAERIQNLNKFHNVVIAIFDIDVQIFDHYVEFLKNHKIDQKLWSHRVLFAFNEDEKKYIQLAEGNILIDDIIIKSSMTTQSLHSIIKQNIKTHYQLKNLSEAIINSCKKEETVVEKDVTHTLLTELEQMKAALENTTESILITDMNNNVWYLNEAFGYLFGYTLDRMNDIDLAELISDVDIDDGRWEGEIQAKTSDENIFPAFLRYTDLYNDEFEVTGKVFVFTDLTDIKKQEEEKREMAKVYGVVQMAGAAAHEINQPLQSIMMLSEFILSESDKKDKTYNYLEQINEQVGRIGKMTKNIQKIARQSNFSTKDYVGGEKIIDIFSVEESKE